MEVITLTIAFAQFTSMQLACSLGWPHGIEWTLDYRQLTQIPAHDTLFLYTNNSEIKHIVGFEVHGATYQIVAGSELTPPWTQPFSPLSSQTFPVSASSPGYVVGPAQTLEVYIEFLRETGLERWYGVDGEAGTAVIAQRTRWWDTPSPAIIQIRCE